MNDPGSSTLDYGYFDKNFFEFGLVTSGITNGATKVLNHSDSNYH